MKIEIIGSPGYFIISAWPLTNVWLQSEFLASSVLLTTINTVVFVSQCQQFGIWLLFVCLIYPWGVPKVNLESLIRIMKNTWNIYNFACVIELQSYIIKDFLSRGSFSCNDIIQASATN